jgi:hypothetical protein
VCDHAEDHRARRSLGERFGIDNIGAGLRILLRASANARVKLSAAFGIFIGVNDVKPASVKPIPTGSTAIVRQRNSAKIETMIFETRIIFHFSFQHS